VKIWEGHTDISRRTLHTSFKKPVLKQKSTRSRDTLASPGMRKQIAKRILRERAARAGTVRERVYTSAANRTRRISEAKTAAKAQWEADKCTKHHGYRLKGKAGSKIPIPMNSVTPLAARFYRLKSGHAPVGTYLKRFGHRDNDKCWWCGGGGRMVAQTREHVFRHCRRWRDEQKTL